jgi:benzoylformate decarboxylase
LNSEHVPKIGGKILEQAQFRGGSIQYAITALWTAASYKSPLIVIVASNAEYGVLKQFAGIEKISGVPGLDLPGLDVVACAAAYGVTAREAHNTDELVELFRAGLANHDRPLLINVPITRVSSSSRLA